MILQLFTKSWQACRGAPSALFIAFYFFFVAKKHIAWNSGCPWFDQSFISGLDIVIQRATRFLIWLFYALVCIFLFHWRTYRFRLHLHIKQVLIFGKVSEWCWFRLVFFFYILSKFQSTCLFLVILFDNLYLGWFWLSLLFNFLSLRIKTVEKIIIIEIKI